MFPQTLCIIKRQRHSNAPLAQLKHAAALSLSLCTPGRSLLRLWRWSGGGVWHSMRWLLEIKLQGQTQRAKEQPQESKGHIVNQTHSRLSALSPDESALSVQPPHPLTEAPHSRESQRRLTWHWCHFYSSPVYAVCILPPFTVSILKYSPTHWKHRVLAQLMNVPSARSWFELMRSNKSSQVLKQLWFKADVVNQSWVTVWETLQEIFISHIYPPWAAF